MRARFFLAASLFLAVGANAQELNCLERPGAALCRALANAENLHHYKCTGAACYELWQSQIRALNTFTQTYDAQVGYAPTASAQLGDLAYRVSSLVCRTTATGDCNWMRALYVAKRDALPLLKELQVGAGIAAPYSCTVSYSCP